MCWESLLPCCHSQIETALAPIELAPLAPRDGQAKDLKEIVAAAVVVVSGRHDDST